MNRRFQFSSVYSKVTVITPNNSEQSIFYYITKQMIFYKQSLFVSNKQYVKLQVQVVCRVYIIVQLIQLLGHRIKQQNDNNKKKHFKKQNLFIISQNLQMPAFCGSHSYIFVKYVITKWEDCVVQKWPFCKPTMHNPLNHACFSRRSLWNSKRRIRLFWSFLKIFQKVRLILAEVISTA